MYPEARSYSILAHDLSWPGRIHFAIFVALERFAVRGALLHVLRSSETTLGVGREARARRLPVPRKHAEATALLETFEILLRVAHLGIDTIHAAIDRVELL